MCQLFMDLVHKMMFLVIYHMRMVYSFGNQVLELILAEQFLLVAFPSSAKYFTQMLVPYIIISIKRGLSYDVG